MNNKLVCIVYDFDNTLAPGNMQDYSFIQKIQCEANSFWHESTQFKITNNMDPVLSYMYMMLNKARQNSINVTRAMLNSCGENIQMYPRS